MPPSAPARFFFTGGSLESKCLRHTLRSMLWKLLPVHSSGYSLRFHDCFKLFDQKRGPHPQIQKGIFRVIIYFEISFANIGSMRLCIFLSSPVPSSCLRKGLRATRMNNPALFDVGQNSAPFRSALWPQMISEARSGGFVFAHPTPR